MEEEEEVITHKRNEELYGWGGVLLLDPYAFMKDSMLVEDTPEMIHELVKIINQKLLFWNEKWGMW